MPKIKVWILIGLIIFFSAISFLFSPLFLIFSFFLIAIGVGDNMDLKQDETSREEEILDSREIPVEINQSKPRGILKKEQTLNNQEVLTVDDQNKSGEVSESSDNTIRQSKALAIKMKIKEKEKKPEIIVVPEESVELKKETENQEESEEEEDRNESFGGKINKTCLRHYLS